MQRQKESHSQARFVGFGARWQERAASTSSDGCFWLESLLVFEQITD